ncbi:MAG: hypothetical protein ACJ72U_00590 [Nitrososphaeraceae archaeon]
MKRKEESMKNQICNTLLLGTFDLSSETTSRTASRMEKRQGTRSFAANGTAKERYCVYCNNS